MVRPPKGSGAQRVTNGDRLLSFSECTEQQEAMLLMPVQAWIRSSVGRFVLVSCEPRPWFARLVLSGEGRMRS